jgi:phosphinothricin acetyltransferase
VNRTVGLGPVEIGPGTDDDIPGIVQILDHAAVSSHATLTSQPLSEADQRKWFERFAPAGPYRLLVARRGGQVAGFAASRPFREHKAFRQTVEVSIALDVASRGLGVGTALYRALFESLAEEPVHVALASIVLPNEASVALHRKLGFTEVGTFHEYAVKNGQYLSSLWLERRCQPGQRPGPAR